MRHRSESEIELLELSLITQLDILDLLRHAVKPTPVPVEDTKGYFTELSMFEGSLLLTKIKGKLNIMALTLTDTQQAAGVIAFVDKKGAATDAASVSLTVSDPNVAAASYDDPSNTITVVAGQPGVAALTIVALDSKGNQLPFDDVAIEVTAGDAVSGSISFGAPTEQA